jgi:endonuclease/exonuclease/phosphatase (EEP) superfamily protein YafD
LADCPGEAVRLVQFNILRDNQEVRTAAAWIDGAQPDVITLEEATFELPIVALLRPHYPYAVACAPQLRCSTVILSRRPFIAAGGLAKGDPENRKALSAAWATIPTRAGPFTLAAAHFDRPWPWHNNPGDRAQLTQFIRSRDLATTLLAGDFNLPSGTFQIRQLTQGLGLTRAPDIRSWPARAGTPPAVAIDHVFYGSRFTIARIARGPLLGSDHYPLLVDLRLRPQTCGIPTR